MKVVIIIFLDPRQQKLSSMATRFQQYFANYNFHSFIKKKQNDSSQCHQTRRACRTEKVCRFHFKKSIQNSVYSSVNYQTEIRSQHQTSFDLEQLNQEVLGALAPVW